MGCKKYFALGLLLIPGIWGSPAARAGDSTSASIWSGLVLATTAEHPKEAPPELAKYVNQLKDIFGYNQFELMGQHQEVMNSPDERWLIPGKEFSLLVSSKKASKPGFNYRLNLQLYQDKKLLAGMEGRFCGQNLLFIRGPAHDDGQLIIVFVVK